MAQDRSLPRHTQYVALRLSGLKAPSLQTIANRDSITLDEQNPGKGRSRKYSDVDIIKLAIMRRLANLHLSLALSKEIAEGAAIEFLRDGGIAWDLCIFVRPESEARRRDDGITFIRSSNVSPLSKFEALEGDPSQIPLSQFLYDDNGIAPRRPQPTVEQQLAGARWGTMPIDPGKRDFWALQGIHAEPIIAIPLGEIVNATLLQIDALSSEGDA